MAYLAVFKRYEIKYLISLEQKEKIIETIKAYMALDEYGRTTIRNIYFDTDNYRLIRHSIEKEALRWLGGVRHCSEKTQITDEIDYFFEYYQTLHPVVFLSYEREAYYCKSGGDFRVTFDEAVLFRQDHISLEEEIWGTPVLPEGMVIMEIKCSGGMPMWMTQLLTSEKIYKTSFSKYGTVYQKFIYPQLKEGKFYG